MGALRDIKCDMAARRASLQKLIVHEVETRIFQVADAAAESGAAAVVPSAAAAQKAHLRSARPALYGFQSLCFSSLNALSQMLTTPCNSNALWQLCYPALCTHKRKPTQSCVATQPAWQPILMNFCTVA